jgi:hypothetical protein
MLERYNSNEYRAEKPNIISFTSAIDARACCTDNEMAALKAENILKLMEYFIEQRIRNAVPNFIEGYLSSRLNVTSPIIRNNDTAVVRRISKFGKMFSSRYKESLYSPQFFFTTYNFFFSKIHDTIL